MSGGLRSCVSHWYLQDLFAIPGAYKVTLLEVVLAALMAFEDAFTALEDTLTQDL